MGTLERYSIPYKGLAAGIHTFEFEIDDALFESVGSTDILGGQAVAEVKMTKAASTLTFDVHIRGTVRVECDRCLDEVALPVDATDRLTVKFSDEPVESDGEVMWISPSDGEVQLGRFIYETILLALPFQRTHESIDQCNPEMVKRFRIVSQEEFDRLTEPKPTSLKEGSAGAALEELKHKLENK